MQDLIEAIRKENHDILYLADKVNTFYITSKAIRDVLVPKLEEAIANTSPRHKELLEMGEMSPTNRYYFLSTIDKKEFIRLLRDENFSKDEDDLHKLYIDLAPQIYEMERTKVLFQAYKHVLSRSLDMLNYNYNQKD